MLVKEGQHVDIACNYKELMLDKLYEELGCESYQIDFSRSPLSKDNVKAYEQLKKVIEKGNYDIVHCHTPNAAVITRLVCRKFRKRTGLKVFYTAHGFHFYKGAPMLNWMVYYPVEKFCSRFTDKLITINREDYVLAQRHMHAKTVKYVSGVGIDTKKFDNKRIDKLKIKKELGIPENSFLLLSVGELNQNKNHQTIIKALAELKDRHVHYAIAGSGELYDYLEQLARDLNVADQVHLLGFRNDLPDIYRVADVFCFPSYREGLGLAAIEAMSCGLPIITSNVHGINDYSRDGITGYKCSPDDVDGFTCAIDKLMKDSSFCMAAGKYNSDLAKKYDYAYVNYQMKQIYQLNV